MPAEHFSVAFRNYTILSADMVHTHGVSPSVCHVIAKPDSLGGKARRAIGSLSFVRNGLPVFTFEDCAVVRVQSLPPNPVHGVRVSVDIADRRWRWRYKHVDGHFNQRDSVNEVVAATEKSYEDVIKHVLAALDEDDYTLIMPPTVPSKGPEVSWNRERADLALQDICTQLGLMIHLGLDNKVWIGPIGQGRRLFDNRDRRTVPVIFRNATKPNIIKVVFAPTVYQQELELEAVILDPDGELRKLDESQIALDNGEWSKYFLPGMFDDQEIIGDPIYPPEVLNTDKYRDRSRAAQIVYKWYQVKDFEEPHALPSGELVEERACLLPIRPGNPIMNSREYDDESGSWDGQAYDVPPYITGLTHAYWSQYGYCAIYHYQNFDLDANNGVVKCREFMFLQDGDTGDGQSQLKWEDTAIGFFRPAELSLMCSFNARPTVQDGLNRFSHDVRIAGAVTGGDITAVVKIDNEFLFVDDEGNTNQAQLEEIAQEVADSYGLHYELLQEDWAQWTGIQKFPLSGNMPQIRWVVDRLGAFTYGGKNCEHPGMAPTWKERRMREEFSREVP